MPMKFCADFAVYKALKKLSYAQQKQKQISWFCV